MKKLMLAGLVAAALGSLSVPVEARTNVDIIVDVAPPPARVEVVPAARVGYVWVPGFWEWRGHHHVWVSGRWVRERRGYLYAPARWEEVNGRWIYRPGVWHRHDR